MKPNKPVNLKEVIKLRKKLEEEERKKQLLFSPEEHLIQKGSDEYLDNLSKKIFLINGTELPLEAYVNGSNAKHETKFFKKWFQKLAELYGVDPELMKPFVKPSFVRLFIINFVYGRFPYMVLRTLRKNKRKSGLAKSTLFQHMTAEAREQLDIVVSQIFDVMCKTDTPRKFAELYCSTYHLHFQLNLFSDGDDY